MKRGKAILVGGVLTLVAGAVVFGGYLSAASPPPSASAATVPAATAQVTRGTLRDTRTMTGTLSYGELSAMRPSLTATSAMVTWIAPVGTTIERGEPLYTLDGEPAILFYGSVPQHRTLRFEPAAASPVWVELEQAETAARAADLTLRLEQARLADAEARVNDATFRLEDGLSSKPRTAEFMQLRGAVEAADAKLGRVKELSAAALAPAAEISAAEAELAAARANLDAAVRDVQQELAGARLDAITARTAVADAEVKRDELATAQKTLAARATDQTDVRQIGDNLTALGYLGPIGDQVRAWQRDAGLPMTGIVGPAQLFVAAGPIHVAAHSASIGETLVESSPDRGSILDFSRTEKLVTVPLNVTDQGLAAVGRAVIVTLPDDTEIEGRISEVGSVVTDGTIEVKVTIEDQPSLGTLEVASVNVEFVSSSRDDVLSVPIGALLAMPEGGYAVEVVTDTRSTLVPVDTGLFAASRVEISGDGIAEGMLVGVPG